MVHCVVRALEILKRIPNYWALNLAFTIQQVGAHGYLAAFFTKRCILIHIYFHTFLLLTSSHDQRRRIYRLLIRETAYRYLVLPCTSCFSSWFCSPPSRRIFFLPFVSISTFLSQKYCPTDIQKPLEQAPYTKPRDFNDFLKILRSPVSDIGP